VGKAPQIQERRYIGYVSPFYLPKNEGAEAPFVEVQALEGLHFTIKYFFLFNHK